MMNEDEIIAVVTAYKEGKTIQCKSKRPHQRWNKTDKPIWNFADIDYRIKPEPREYWIDLATGCITKIENMKVRIGDERHIHVIEVLDEEG